MFELKSYSLLFLIFFFNMNVNASSQRDWVSVFHHKPNGKVVSGSKNALIEAIRAGASVRIYLKTEDVEHLMDANFITILGNEVFAQIDRIRGQVPK